jgi:hypothetical protein
VRHRRHALHTHREPCMSHEHSIRPR